MPLAFILCQKRGGKVRTKQLGGKNYVHVCMIDGKEYRGEVKQRKGTYTGKDKMKQMYR